MQSEQQINHQTEQLQTFNTNSTKNKKISSQNLSKTINFTNLQFSSNIQSTKRIHGKQSIKRFVKKGNNKEKKQQQNKQNNMNPSITMHDLKKKIKQSQQRVLSKMFSSVVAPQGLQIKSIQLNQQLTKLHTQRSKTSSRRLHSARSSKNISEQIKYKNNDKQKQLDDIDQSQNNIFQNKSQEQIIKRYIKTQVLTSNNSFKESIHEQQLKLNFKKQKQQNQTKQLFQQINRVIERQKDTILKVTKANNCYYNKLKNKLQKQVNKIIDKKQRDRLNFIIQGCGVQKQIRQGCDPFRQAITQRKRPRTAVSRSGLQIKKMLVNKLHKRPQTSKSRKKDRMEIKYIASMNDSQIKMFSTQKIYEKQNRITSAREKYQPKNTKTLRHVNKYYKQNNNNFNKKDIQRQKSKQKLLQILVGCQQQSLDNKKLHKGLQIFQYFCKKVDKKLVNTCEKINNELQKPQEDQVQYL